MWIDEYRQRNGLELDDLARKVNAVGRELHPPWDFTVTDMLIHILEISKTPRTHPLIANAIAVACEATREQRDSIVDERHRGTFEPITVKCSWRDMPIIPKNEYAVVMVDRAGRVLKRYNSAKIAAMYGDLTDDSIKRRCNRRIPNEFSTREYTYRYAREWNKMSQIEKLRDLGVNIDE